MPIERHHRPDDAGGSVGERDRHELGRLPRQHRAHPFAILGRALAPNDLFCSIAVSAPHAAERRRPPRRVGSECICRHVCWFAPAAPCRRRNSGAASCRARPRILAQTGTGLDR